MGTFAFLWGLAAVFLFFAKRMFRHFQSKRFQGRDVIRRILLLSKSHHNVFGWVTLITAGCHGFYFLFHTPNSLFEFYSGAVAWIALVLLALSGIWMTRMAKLPKQAKIMRFSHLSLTMGYAGALFLHFRGSLFLSVLLFTAAFISMGLMIGATRLTQFLKNLS